MKIAIGSDHAGFRYKEKIKLFVKRKGHEICDYGTHSEDSVDYPLFIRPVAEAVARGEYDRGIVLGGSGNGEAMAANKVKGIRCALCWNMESARLSRQHNDANMLSLGERMLSQVQAFEIVEIWLDTPFEGGRHLKRIKQLEQKESMGDPLQDTGELEGVKKKKSKTPMNENYDVLISFRYIMYSEGKSELEFEVEPGLKNPTVILIPSSERWASELPGWACDRRDEILNRIKSKCTHLKPEYKEI